MAENIKILIVGSGGRETAIVLALQKSEIPHEIFFTGWPNPQLLNLATYIPPAQNQPDDQLVELATELQIDLAIIGPEAPLERGLADKFWNHHIPCFGPRQALAEIETSKSKGRQLVQKLHNKHLNPKFQIFRPNHYPSFPETEIIHFIESVCYQYVIKADGLCGGKGVKVSGVHLETIQDGLSYCRELYHQNAPFIVEEKLHGQEFSLHSITDGETFFHFPPVKDYKRAYENDQGPNTGSMGSITCQNHRLPFLTPEDIEIAQKVNQEAIAQLQDYYHEDISYGAPPYIGVLYGSFIKTGDPVHPIKVIEFNARFGDPECINLLSIFQGDLLRLISLSVNQRLSDYPSQLFTFQSVNTVLKYLVPQGYPTNPVKNHEIYLNQNTSIQEGIEMYHASLEYHRTTPASTVVASTVVAMPDNLQGFDTRHLYQRGSRALAILGKAQVDLSNIANAINREADKIWGPLYYRKDIGVTPLPTEVFPRNKYLYQKAGVDITAYNRALQSIRSSVESTHHPQVLSQFGDFGGIYQIFPSNSPCYPSQYSDTLLVASTDGVGTKTKFILSTMGTEEGYPVLGQDLVNHCVNDILVMGATPIFFLDYYASSVICQDHLAAFLQGISMACRQARTAILGGETAEMPGIYQPDQVDVVGTIVGMVHRRDLLKAQELVQAGDYVLAFPSSGPHTNGYSLIRSVCQDFPPPPEVLSKLNQPHRSYLPFIERIRESKPGQPLSKLIHGLVHITGGGLLDNPVRILPPHLKMVLETSKWEIPIEFRFLQQVGQIPAQEMYRVFNCGLGMLVVVPLNQLFPMLELFNENECRVVGKIDTRQEGESGIEIL